MRPERCRSGLSLVELAAVIAILGLIGAAIGSVVGFQQRYFRQARDLLSARQSVRDAVQVLSADIRAASIADTIRLMTDSAIEAFAGIGSSVVCRAVSENIVTLPEESAAGATLTSFLALPDTGDLAVVYLRAGTADSLRQWQRRRIVAFTESAPGDGCLIAGGAPRETFRLTLHPHPDGEIERGVPVRFIRRGRYSLYRSSDRDWYMGYRRCNAIGESVCGGIQPVSGPYRPYSPDWSRTGFLFQYFDARGEPLSALDSPLEVARIDITARAQRAERRLIGGEVGAIADSARMSIGIRNR